MIGVTLSNVSNARKYDQVSKTALPFPLPLPIFLFLTLSDASSAARTFCVVGMRASLGSRIVIFITSRLDLLNEGEVIRLMTGKRNMCVSVGMALMSADG